MCVCGTSEKTCNFFSCFKGYLQGACGHHANACQRSYAWWWKQSLINSVHLLFQFCNLLYSGNGTRQSREPLHRHILLHVRLPQSELWMVYFLIWFYACTIQSNIQIWGHGSTMETSGKGFGFTSLLTLFYMIIPMSTSSRTPPIHDLFWFCVIGIQFPLDHYDDPFLI